MQELGDMGVLLDRGRQNEPTGVTLINFGKRLPPFVLDAKALELWKLENGA